MIEFIITQTYRSKEDRDAYLREAKVASIESLSQKEKGNIRYEYLLPTDGDEKKVILIEMWETPEDQKVHTSSAHFAVAMQLKAKYIVDSSMEKFEIKRY